MKISVTQVTPQVTFGSLPAGDLFVYAGCLFLKIASTPDFDNAHAVGGITCMCIEVDTPVKKVTSIQAEV